MRIRIVRAARSLVFHHPRGRKSKNRPHKSLRTIAPIVYATARPLRPLANYPSPAAEEGGVRGGGGLGTEEIYCRKWVYSAAVCGACMEIRDRLPREGPFRNLGESARDDNLPGEREKM